MRAVSLNYHVCPIYLKTSQELPVVTITRKTDDLPLVVPNIAVVNHAKELQEPGTSKLNKSQLFLD